MTTTEEITMLIAAESLNTELVHAERMRVARSFRARFSAHADALDAARRRSESSDWDETLIDDLHEIERDRRKLEDISESLKTQLVHARRMITRLRVQARAAEYRKHWTRDSRQALEMARQDVYELEHEGASLEGYAGVSRWEALPQSEIEAIRLATSMASGLIR